MRSPPAARPRSSSFLDSAAYWDPTIRLLHLFESLPYLVAAVLCLRQQKFGYMLGAAGGAFWLWTAGTLTTFIRNGFERVAMVLRTGHVDRPDILIAAPAACATGGLVLFSLWDYSRVGDLGLFLCGTIGRLEALFGINLLFFPPPSF